MGKGGGRPRIRNQANRWYNYIRSRLVGEESCGVGTQEERIDTERGPVGLLPSLPEAFVPRAFLRHLELKKKSNANETTADIYRESSQHIPLRSS